MLLQNKVNRWKWYAYLSCNITNCKSGISFNDFLYFGNDFFTRCRFWPTWFRCIFDGLKFLFPPPNCVIRHTRRSKSSRNFSHQLLQRTTKFWASFDVSPYFIFFVDASTNLSYCSGQWLRVFKWQILCLTLSLTYIYTPLCRYWITLYRYVLVFIVPHVDIELEDNEQFISNIPRIYATAISDLISNPWIVNHNCGGRHIEFFFRGKRVLVFLVGCLLGGWFRWNIETCFFFANL